NLTSTIYLVRTARGSTQCFEIHDFAIVPKNPSDRICAQHRIDYAVFRHSNDVPARVDRCGDAAVVASRQRIQVGQDPVFPFESVVNERNSAIEASADEAVAYCGGGYRGR